MKFLITAASGTPKDFANALNERIREIQEDVITSTEIDEQDDDYEYDLCDVEERYQ